MAVKKDRMVIADMSTMTNCKKGHGCILAHSSEHKEGIEVTAPIEVLKLHNVFRRRSVTLRGVVKYQPGNAPRVLALELTSLFR